MRHPSDDPQIISLAAEIQEELAAQPEVTTMALVDAAQGAWHALESCPQLDEIAACYGAGPEDYCAFCSSGGLSHTSDPQPVPEWVQQVRDEKGAAQATLHAIQLALAPQPDEVLELTDPARFGTWLAQEYTRDRGNFYQLVSDLERDQSPQTQQALAIASRIISGGQPTPVPRPLPGGNMSHTMAAGHNRKHTLGVQRKYYLLEGHRSARFGAGIGTGDTVSSGRDRPPPPEERAPAGRKARGARRPRPW